MARKLLDFHAAAVTAAHLATAVAHPTLTYLVLVHVKFTYPATLALIQVTTTALCLWFWSVFGLFRVRRIPLRALVPLAASAAALALFALYLLAATSLRLFHTARLLSAIFVLAVRARNPLAALIATIAAVCACAATDVSLVAAIAYAAFAASNVLLLHPVAVATQASELQLQILLRSLAAAFLVPALLLDDFSRDPSAIWYFPLSDVDTVLIFLTGFLAFCAFVASRASVHHLTPCAHNTLVFVANLALYAAYYTLFTDTVEPLPVAGGIVLCVVWMSLAERRRLEMHACDFREESPPREVETDVSSEDSDQERQR